MSFSLGFNFKETLVLAAKKINEINPKTVFLRKLLSTTFTDKSIRVIFSSEKGLGA